MTGGMDPEDQAGGLMFYGTEGVVTSSSDQANDTPEGKMAKSRGMMPAGRHGQNSGCHSGLAAGSVGKEAAGDAQGTGRARSGRA